MSHNGGSIVIALVGGDPLGGKAKGFLAISSGNRGA